MTRVALIGAGDICPAYVNGLRRFPVLKLVGLADARHEAAVARGRELDVPVFTLDALLASDADIIINLTPPQAHFEVCRRILAAGKHVYTEKPLAATFGQGQQLLADAKQRGLRVGCAPDTFLGAAGQTARRFVDQGGIGAVVAGQAIMMERGPDDWHPNPGFFYATGAGPLLDMGVYYLTQLVQLLGPVERVQGLAHTSWSPRIVPRGERKGATIEVDTPSHVTGGLRFASGAFVSLTTSFDVWKHASTPVELYGADGTLLLPDPNNFGGELRYSQQDGDWQGLPLSQPFDSNLRGLGVAEMADAIREGRPHRASGEMALHVLEVMETLLQSAAQQRPLPVHTRCERPAPLDTLPGGFA